MNWVERKFQKEKSIEAGGNDLWENLTLTINEACDSFNSRYGNEYSKVAAKPEGTRRLRVTRVIHKKVSADHSRPEDISLQIAYESKKSGITAVCQSVGVVSTVDLEYDEKQSPSPFIAKDGNRISDDQASEILLNEFLFNPKFLIP